MNLHYSLQRFAWKAVDWLFPPTCAGCGKNYWRFCPDCLANVALVPNTKCIFCGKKHTSHFATCEQFSHRPVYFSGAAAWGYYGGALREAIHALKYHQDLALGDFFSVYLIQIVESLNWNFDLVVPVPLSTERRKERAYNQSALLSRPIAAYFSVAHSVSALRRVKETGSQISRTRIERDLALEDAFLGNPDKLKGKTVLLVDDIITTGATINHCAYAMKAAGAQEVFALSVAKTPRKITHVDPRHLPVP